VIPSRNVVTVLVCVLFGLLTSKPLRAGVPNGTAFTYKGQLGVSNSAVAGTYNITFALYDAIITGTQIGPILTNTVTVGTNGVFMSVLDFGPSAFNGEARWLELSVRTNGNGAFTKLSPRQALTPTPYAMQAATAGQVAAANIVGTLSSSQFAPSVTFSNLATRYANLTNATVQSLTVGTVSGSGAALRNMPISGDPLARFAPTPSLIYSPYYDFYNSITNYQTDAFLRLTAQKMATNGLLAAGWNWIWLDDSWPDVSRDSGGNLIANPVRFPLGIPSLVNYLHGLGFKVGIYSSFGASTCLNFPGSDESHLAQDAQTFASWGIDGLKLDACGQPNFPEDAYSYNRRMLHTAANSILNANRDMALLAVTMTDSWDLYGGRPLPWEARSYANMWVVWGVTETIASVSNAVMNAAYTVQYGSHLIAPGHYPWQGAFDTRGMDLSSLQAGITMAAMVSAPMSVGTNWPAGVLNLLTNSEVLSVHQDAAAICASIAWSNNLAELWTKPLGGAGSGSTAIALVNLAPTNQTVLVNWSMLGASASDPLTIRDLWNRNTLGSYTNSWSTLVPSNSVLLYRATAQTGLTTNVAVLRPGGLTNTLIFKKGVLIDVK